MEYYLSIYYYIKNLLYLYVGFIYGAIKLYSQQLFSDVSLLY